MHPGAPRGARLGGLTSSTVKPAASIASTIASTCRTACGRWHQRPRSRTHNSRPRASGRRCRVRGIDVAARAARGAVRCGVLDGAGASRGCSQSTHMRFNDGQCAFQSHGVPGRGGFRRHSHGRAEGAGGGQGKRGFGRGLTTRFAYRKNANDHSWPVLGSPGRLPVSCPLSVRGMAKDAANKPATAEGGAHHPGPASSRPARKLPQGCPNDGANSRESPDPPIRVLPPEPPFEPARPLPAPPPPPASDIAERLLQSGRRSRRVATSRKTLRACARSTASSRSRCARSCRRRSALPWGRTGTTRRRRLSSRGWW